MATTLLPLPRRASRRRTWHCDCGRAFRSRAGLGIHRAWHDRQPPAAPSADPEADADEAALVRAMRALQQMAAMLDRTYPTGSEHCDAHTVAARAACEQARDGIAFVLPLAMGRPSLVTLAGRDVPSAR